MTEKGRTRRATWLAVVVLGLLASGGCRTVSGPRAAEAPGDGVRVRTVAAWPVVVAADAGPAERYAAEEFARLIAAVTGRTPPDVVATGAPPREAVLIGGIVHVADLREVPDDLGAEDLWYRVAADRLAIIGGGPRGTLYGVYSFFEDELGVRFLTADHTHVPRIGRWTRIATGARLYRPPLSFRSSYYAMNHDTAFAARIRNNANIRDEARYGGITPDRLINHSVQGLLPTRRYGEAHPEYYALVDGERRWDVGGRDWAWDGTQPCFSNPEVVALLITNTLAEIERHPERGNVSVSQNDNNQYCRCADCRAIDEPEGSPMASLLTAVNAVADVVAQRHPDVKVGTLSYRYSRKPPATILPRPNVQIQLCSFEGSQFHAIDDPASARNAAFCDDLRAWSERCERVFIWHYNVSFRNYLMPCANLYKLDRDIRFFVAHNARGVLMQGAYNAKSTEFADLRHYVISRLLWNPSLDGAALVDEFLRLHYGPAAEDVRSFVDYVHRRAVDSGLEPQCSQHPDAFGIDADFGRVGVAAFDRALEKVGDDGVLRARVEKASIAAHRCAIEPVWSHVVAAVPRRGRPAPEVEPLPSELRDAHTEAVARFVALCDRHGVSMVSEGMPYADWRTQAARLFELE